MTSPVYTTPSGIDFSIEEYAAIIGEDQRAFTEEVFMQVSPGAEFLHNWHLDCIVEHLRAVELGQIPSLIINMPPRMMKSISVSIAWPAWLLGQDPTRQIIVGSYATAIGVELSRKTMAVMNSDIYKMAFDTRLAKETEDWFTTTKMGHRFVATNGKAPTGFGCDYLLIDDPINPMESLSDTVRMKTNDWITGTLFPRANDPKTIKKVMVMQRLHQDDPTGHLLADGGWYHLCLPVEFKSKRTISIGNYSHTVEAGEWLHPERIDGETLDKMARDGMTPYQISGQYMQTPTPDGGGEFKPQWLQYYDPGEIKPRSMNIYILYDPANSKKKSSGHDPDYTAMMVVGLAPDNNYYLLDMVRDRLNPTERVRELIKLHQRWNSRAGKPPKVACEQYGMMSDAFYIRQAQRTANYRFPLIEVGGSLKKEERIKKLIPAFEEGRVYFPKTLHYSDVNKESVNLVESLLDEYESFPVGRHDDMLDAFARIMDPDVMATFPRLKVELLKAGEPDYDRPKKNEDWDWRGY